MPRNLMLLALSLTLLGQEHPPHMINGRPITPAEFESILAQMPPELKVAVAANPEEVLRSYPVSKRVAEMADRLDTPLN